MTADGNGPEAEAADEAQFLAARISDQARNALAQMRERWGDTWEFAMAPGMIYTARRRDGRGEPLTAEDPSDLRRMVAEAGDGLPYRDRPLGGAQ